MKRDPATLVALIVAPLVVLGVWLSGRDPKPKPRPTGPAPLIWAPTAEWSGVQYHALRDSAFLMVAVVNGRIVAARVDTIWSGK